jgi:hypothetical protein
MVVAKKGILTARFYARPSRTFAIRISSAPGVEATDLLAV